MINQWVDTGFIATLEGGQHLQGYVPNAGRSGVTIATGFDLGARRETDLRRLNLPQDLISKLRPYLGLQRNRATKKLRTPLIVTQDQADQIDAAVMGSILEKIVKAYDGAVFRHSFALLPPAVRTVVFSVGFQYGPALPKRCPRFWGTAIARDYPAIVAELESFGDSYSTRRRCEAAYLRGAMSAANPWRT